MPTDRDSPRRMIGSAGVDGSVELAELDIFAYPRRSSEPLERQDVYWDGRWNWLVGELQRERTASEHAFEHRLCTEVRFRPLAVSA